MDELHERMLEDLYTLIGFENAGREELCFFLRSAEEKALRFTRQWELIGGMPQSSWKSPPIGFAGRRRAGGRAASSKPD